VDARIALAAGQLDGDREVELIAAAAGADSTLLLTLAQLPAHPSGDPVVSWGGAADPTRSSVYATASSGGPVTGGFGLGDAYLWPNPVRGGTAHLRFSSGRSGTLSLKVYDLVGRRLVQRSAPVTAGVENEVLLDVSPLPSGTYVARLEAGGERTLIRFAVVQ
jgi:hypothetical protein